MVVDLSLRLENCEYWVGCRRETSPSDLSTVGTGLTANPLTAVTMQRLVYLSCLSRIGTLTRMRLLYYGIHG